MTRLSEALKRAAATPATPVVATEQPLPATGEWQFAPVETMYVPEARTTEATPPDAVVAGATAARPPQSAPAARPDVAQPPSRVRFGEADRDKLVVSDTVDRAV